MEPTLVTETSEVKTQTPGKFPEESTLGINGIGMCISVDILSTIVENVLFI
jgi:hypothetical protein